MKTKKTKFKISWFSLLIITFALYGSYLCIIQQIEIYNIHKESEVIKTKIEAINQQNSLLEKEKEKLKNPAYIEKLAREELGLVRPGEIPVVTVNER